MSISAGACNYFPKEGNAMIDKAIEHGKEHRKPYYRSSRSDKTCRPHGSCSYCENNRFHATKVRELAAEQQLRELIEEEGV